MLTLTSLIVLLLLVKSASPLSSRSSSCSYHAVAHSAKQHTSHTIGRIVDRVVRGVSTTIAPVALSSLILPKHAAAAVAEVAASAFLEDAAYEKSLFNVPPTSRLLFPSYLAGSWSADFRFAGAEFTPQLPLQQLAQNPNIPGFRKYSVAFVPDFGSDCTATLRFLTDSSISREEEGRCYEDRSYNVRALIAGFLSSARAVVDSFDCESDSRCSLSYHDDGGEGRIELFTNSRRSRALRDGGFENFEQLRQFSTRLSRSNRHRSSSSAGSSGSGSSSGSSSGNSSSGGGTALSGSRSSSGSSSQTIGDYALRWRFAPPSSSNSNSNSIDSSNTFSSNKSNSNSNGISVVRAQLQVFSYLQPQDPLYFQRPSKPVGAFLYNVLLTRTKQQQQQ